MVSVFYFFGLLAAVIAAYVGYDAETMNVLIGDVANVQLMHVQSSKLTFALAFAIIAAMLLSVGALIQVITSRRGPD